MTLTKPGYQPQIDKLSILLFGIESETLESIRSDHRIEADLHPVDSVQNGLTFFKSHAVDLIIALNDAGNSKGTEFVRRAQVIAPNVICVLFTNDLDTNSVSDVADNVSIRWFHGQHPDPERLRHELSVEIQSLRAFAQLRKSESKYRSAFDSMSDVFTRADLNGVCTMVSPSIYKLIGYTQEEVIGRKIADFYEDPRVRDKMVERLMKHKKVENAEINAVRKDGQVITVSTNSKVIFDDDGIAIGIEGNVRDITDKKRAEKALIESEHMLSEAQKIANIGNWKWDIAENETFWSDNLYHILGVKAAEVAPSKNSFFERIHPEDTQLVEQRVRIILSDHLPFSIDHRIVRPDGEVRYVNSQARLACDEEDHPIKLYGILQDITHRVKREQELYIKDKAITSAISGIGMTDAEGKLFYANDALVRMWGYDNAKEMLGKSLPDFWEGEGVFNTIAVLKERGWDKGEDTGKKKDGSLFHVEYSAHMINDQKGNPNIMFGSFFDITDRKKAERELQESEEKFKGIFDSMIDVFSRSDPQGNCLLISPSVLDVIGYTPEEIIGKNYADFYSNPQDWRKLNEELLDKGEIRNIESVIRKKDGSTTIISSNAKVVYDEIGLPIHIDSVFRDMSAFKKQ